MKMRKIVLLWNLFFEITLCGWFGPKNINFSYKYSRWIFPYGSRRIIKISQGFLWFGTRMDLIAMMVYRFKVLKCTNDSSNILEIQIYSLGPQGINMGWYKMVLSYQRYIGVNQYKYFKA